MSARPPRIILTTLALAALAACAPTPPRPDPTGTEPPISSATIAGTASRSLAVGNPGRPAKPSARRPCLGAAIHTISTSSAEPWTAICIAVGGLVRVENLGPGELTITPTGSASCAYGGGVHMCRLISTGPARFATAARQVTVTVVGGSSPARPSPACEAAGTTVTIDVGDSGMPWSAICMKLGATLRVENLGPEGFSVTPTGIVTCRYEAAVRECGLTRPGTVTITTRQPGQEPRSIIIVAIR